VFLVPASELSAPRNRVVEVMFRIPTFLVLAVSIAILAKAIVECGFAAYNVRSEVISEGASSGSAINEDAFCVAQVSFCSHTLGLVIDTGLANTWVLFGPVSLTDSTVSGTYLAPTFMDNFYSRGLIVGSPSSFPNQGAKFTTIEISCLCLLLVYRNPWCLVYVWQPVRGWGPMASTGIARPRRMSIGS